MRQHHPIQPYRISLRHRLRVQIVNAADVLLEGLQLRPLQPPLALAQLTFEFDGFVVFSGGDLDSALACHDLFQFGESFEEDGTHVGVVDVGVHGKGNFGLGVAYTVAAVEENLGQGFLFLLFGFGLHLLHGLHGLHCLLRQLRVLRRFRVFGRPASPAGTVGVRLQVHACGLRIFRYFVHGDIVRLNLVGVMHLLGGQYARVIWLLWVRIVHRWLVVIVVVIDCLPILSVLHQLPHLLLPARQIPEFQEIIQRNHQPRHRSVLEHRFHSDVGLFHLFQRDGSFEHLVPWFLLG